MTPDYSNVSERATHGFFDIFLPAQVVDVDEPQIE
jgi:hypothetical protein